MVFETPGATDRIVSPTRFCTDRAIRGLVDKYCPKRQARVLDVGCGSGYFPFLLEAGVSGEYLGLDIQSQEMWPEAEGVQNGLRIAFLQYDAEKLGDLEEVFNFIMSIQAFEHIAHDDQAFEGMVRRLEPGGHILLTVPSQLSRYTIYPKHGYRGYTRHDLERFSRTGDVEIVQVTKLGGAFTFALHLAAWTLPSVVPAVVAHRVFGKKKTFDPRRLYRSSRIASGLLRVLERVFANRGLSLALEGGYGVVFRKLL